MDQTQSGFTLEQLLGTPYGTGTDADAIGSLGQISADEEKRADLANQMKMAQMIRQGPNMPKGTYIPGEKGGVYVAPNALQDAAAAGQSYLGAKMDANAAAKGSALTSNEQTTRQKVMAMVMRHQMQMPGGATDASQDPDMAAIGNQTPTVGQTAPSGGGGQNAPAAAMGPAGGTGPSNPYLTAQGPTPQGLQVNPQNPQDSWRLFQMMNGGQNSAPPEPDNSYAGPTN